jgi:hypothetical protein
MPAPGVPPARRVTPGEVWIKQNILPVPPGSNRIVLGQYLHTFQDSWSHQAEPDVPPTCNSMLAWAHAQVRGGWSCHILNIREPCAALTVTMAPLMLTVGMVRGDGARQPLALCELALEKRLNGQTLSCTEALDAIGNALNQPQRVGPSLAEVRSMSKGPDFDYFVERAPAEGTYIGTVRFRHVMNDVLRLRVRTINGQLRISTFAWVPRQ